MDKKAAAYESAFWGGCSVLFGRMAKWSELKAPAFSQQYNGKRIF
jgi:hypothetical protein